SWHAVWLGLAKRAEAEQRWLDAASYYHGAEFYLPAGEVRNELYDDFARNWALAMKGRSEEHTSELQSLAYLVCRLLLEKKQIILRCESYSRHVLRNPHPHSARTGHLKKRGRIAIYVRANRTKMIATASTRQVFLRLQCN